MDDLTYDDIIKRVTFFRSKANLSLRETSMRLGYNPQFMKTIEDKTIELKVKTLIDFCKVVDINVLDFFYQGKEFSRDDRIFIELFLGLSLDTKRLIVDLIKKLK